MHHSARRASHRLQQCPRVSLLAIEPFWKITIQFDDQPKFYYQHFQNTFYRMHVSDPSASTSNTTKCCCGRELALNSVPMQIISFIWRCDFLEAFLVQCCPPAAAKQLYRAVLLQTAQASGMTFAQTSNVLDPNQQTTDSFHLPGRAEKLLSAPARSLEIIPASSLRCGLIILLYYSHPQSNSYKNHFDMIPILFIYY